MSGERMRVAVAGATGYIGGGVARALHAQGFWVRALTRDEAKTRGAPWIDDVFVGEATERESLRGFCSGVDTVFSSIGIRSFGRKPSLWEVDYRANLNVLEEAREAGAQHFVFVTVVRAEEMARLSGVAEARARVAEAVIASGLDYDILAPTGFFNDMKELYDSARKLGFVALIGDGSGTINPLSSRDLGDLVADLVRRPELRNRVREVGGPDVMSHEEAGRLACSAAGKKPRFLRVSPRLLGAAARGLRPFNYNASAMFGFFRFTAEQADMTGEPIGRRRLADFYAELAKGKTLLEAEDSL